MKVVTFQDMFRDEFRGIYEIKDVNEFQLNVVAHGTHLLRWQEGVKAFRLAELLLDQINGAVKYMCFHERGIWPSSEDKYLMAALCRYAIGKDNLGIDNAIELNIDDRSGGVSFLRLALEFGWGGLLFENRNSWFYFSHDSWGVLSMKGSPASYFTDLVTIEKVIPTKNA